jgi:hypothetical protein
MTYESEIQRDCANQGDVMAAWVVYFITVFGLVGYSLLTILT